MTAGPTRVCRPDELTAGWLTEALAGTDLLPVGTAVRTWTTEPVGTGQMADTVRIRFEADPPASSPSTVIAKFASADEQSRSTGVLTRAYEIEVGVYGSVAGSVRTRMPACYHRHIELETGCFVLLLEDLADARQGDQLAGCSPEAAEGALIELAALHGPAWHHRGLGGLSWLRRGGAEADEFLAGLVTSLWPGFVERYGERMEPAHLELCDRFIDVLGPWLAGRPEEVTVVHGDFRLDNLLFRPGDPRPFVVDWQTAGWGAAASDVSYFLGASLTTEDRRRHGEDLVVAYHRALMREGVTDFGLARLQDEYRRSCFGGLVMTIGAAMLVKRTRRGDDMFATSAARYAQQALDLGAESTLPGGRRG